MKNTRNYSIDLLRIIAMFMVVSLHVLGKGGYEGVRGVVGYEAWALGCLADVAVNCYVLITGYFMCVQQFRFRKVAKIWVQMLFYSVATFAVCVWGGVTEFSLGKLVQAAMPFTFCNYWFVQKYLLLMMTVPFLNAAIQKLTKVEYKFALLLIVGTWCVLNNTLKYLNPFDSTQGFSVGWFIVMYVTAGYIRKYYTPTDRKWRYFSTYLICSAGAFVWRFIFERAGVVVSDYMALDYNSVFIYLGGVSLFLFFLNCKVKTKAAEGVIAFAAPLTLGVYLIHEAPYLKEYIWTIVNPNTLCVNNAFFFIFALGLIAAFSLVCAAIEWVRQKLFHSLYIDRLVNICADRVESAVRKKLENQYDAV